MTHEGFATLPVHNKNNELHGGLFKYFGGISPPTRCLPLVVRCTYLHINIARRHFKSSIRFEFSEYETQKSTDCAISLSVHLSNSGGGGGLEILPSIKGFNYFRLGRKSESAHVDALVKSWRYVRTYATALNCIFITWVPTTQSIPRTCTVFREKHEFRWQRCGGGIQ